MPPLIVIAVLFYAVFSSFDLFHAFGVGYGWLLFALWLTPIFFYHFVSKDPSLTRVYSPLLLAGAIVLIFVGGAGSLNVLQHGGFALVLCSFVPVTLGSVPWLLSAISWMPASSWAASQFLRGDGTIYKFALVACGITFCLYSLQGKKRS